jgi:MoxR-like ATPase
MHTENCKIVDSAEQVLSQVRQVIVGKDDTLLWVLSAILAKGHILLEDIPGVGKTTMALAFPKVIGLDYRRVQFTPDVLPSDVTGYSAFQANSNTMVYQPGAVLCNLFLADELNRATSRAQSALLEAMEEGQVTVDGVSHAIPKPFTVIATQNPTGAVGTLLLPDSQMDRFMIRLRIGYPDAKSEAAMISLRQDGDPLSKIKPVLTRDALLQMQDIVAKTYIKETVVNYIVALVRATREHKDILQGASPRATLAVAAMAKAFARMKGRDYVTPADVRHVFIPTVAHRIRLSPNAQECALSAEQTLKQILSSVKAPSIT